MANGIDVLTALKEITHNKPAGTNWPIHPADAKDLCKINTSDLEAAGWDGTKAEDVNSGLSEGIVEPLGRALGLNLRQNPLALRLVGPRPDQEQRRTQLRELHNNSATKDRVDKLFYAFYPLGTSVLGVDTIGDILSHEYPESNEGD